MPHKWAYFFAIVLAALALAPAMAHLLELPNKIGLPRDDYFTVQGIYRGWALLGIVVVGALISTGTLAILVRGQPLPFAFSLVAFLCVVGTQVVFWTYTYPANQLTNNWMEVPPNWEVVRAQWEYSHAASAILNLVAVIALVLSLLVWKQPAD